MTTKEKHYVDNSLMASFQDPLIKAGFVVALLFWLTLYFISPPESSQDWLLAAPLWYLKLTLLYPMLEELVFRGLVQSQIFSFVRKIELGPFTLANIGTSVVFCGFHFFSHAPLWAGLVIIPSLYFGYLKDKYHSLKQPILMHVVFNAGYFLIFPPVSSL